MVCWIINQYINTPEDPGSSRHYELAKALCKKGYQIVLFGAKRKRKKGLYYVEEREGFKIIWININKYYGRSYIRIINMLYFSIFIFLFSAHKCKKTNIQKPDIIIGSSVHLFGAFSAFLLSQRYATPFLFEIRDLWPQTLVDMNIISPGNLITKVMRRLERTLYEKSVYVISVLPFAWRYIFQNYGISPQKVKWIPNGVNVDYFPAQPMAKSDTLVVSYIGSFGSANALLPIICAAEILEGQGFGGIELHLFGRGPMEGQLKSEVQSRKLTNVRFHKAIAKAELYKVGRLSNAFIVNIRNLDLYQYGISLNKIYDYMAMARPIIMASGAANNPVAEAGSGICVGADDSKGMANAMVELKEMSEKSLFELGMKGREYVSKFHSFEILGKKYGEVILTAAKGDRGAI